MQDIFRKRIIERHKDSLQRHGYTPKTLYWSTQEAQYTRFQVLSEIGVKSGDSILDVGCGFGDLAIYLQQQGIECDYTGIDISPDLIAKGREIHPQLVLIAKELFQFDPSPISFDYLFYSGSLSEKFEGSYDNALRSLKLAYESCRKGVAFNMLSAHDEWIASRSDLQSYYPEQMLEFCQGVADQCELIEGYIRNDFTIYMKKVT